MKICIAMAAVAGLLLVAQPASANVITTLDFDGLATSQSFPTNKGTMYWDVLPTPYGGFSWTPSGDSGWNVDRWSSYYTAYGNSGTNSGNFVSNGNAPLTVSTSSASAFYFVSADFQTWAGSTAPAGSVTVKGYKNGIQQYTKDLALSSTLTTYGPPVANTAIDELRISDASGYWIMDNFKTSPVPEPATMAFLAVGGLMTLIRRRRRG